MKDTTPTLDAGSPLVLDEHARTEPPPACGRGVWVETPFDVATAEGEIALSLRRAKWHEGRAEVEIERVFVTVSLSTGRCAARDASAERFLAEHRWIDDAVRPHLEWLRARARRRDAQRDRTSCFAVIERTELGDMIAHDELFPGDWDLVFEHGGRTYWAVELHCLNAACPCGEVLVRIYEIDPASTEYVGELRVDFASTRLTPKSSGPRAAKLFKPLWARHGAELLMRHGKVRRAVATFAAARAAAVGAVVPVGAVEPRSLPPRNAPCPCGSAKKYKRCCAGRNDRSARSDALASRVSR